MGGPKLGILTLARYKNTAFTSNWEYRFLQNLAKPKGQLLLIPHPSDVWDVTFSPDSKKLATACGDGFARIYQVPEGNLLTTTATKEINIWRVRFSPDGRLLATASGDTKSTSAKVWNATTGRRGSLTDWSFGASSWPGFLAGRKDDRDRKSRWND